MNSAPSVAYEGWAADAAALASALAAALAAADGAALGAAADAAIDGAAEPAPPLHAAMNADRLANPVAARNFRRVTAFADTRRTMASISCSRDGMVASSSSPPVGERAPRRPLAHQDQVRLFPPAHRDRVTRSHALADTRPHGVLQPD